MSRSKRKHASIPDQNHDTSVQPKTKNTGQGAATKQSGAKGAPSPIQKATKTQRPSTQSTTPKTAQPSKATTTIQKQKKSKNQKPQPAHNNVKNRGGALLLPQTFPLRLSLDKDQPLRLPFGRNMPAKIPLLDAIHLAHQLGYQALQVFLSDPDNWQTPLLPPSLALSVRQALTEASFSSVVVHAPFLIDLSAEREQIWIQSLLVLRSTLDQAQLIGASDVVVHLNNYKRAFAPVSEKQIERIVKALLSVLSEGPGTPRFSVRLLLENGCSPRVSPGSRIETLGTILRALPLAYQQQIGVCLDTAHCWVAGYDLSKHVEPFLHLVESTIGLSRVHVLHLNDAKHPLGGIKDEHAQWGTGHISQNGLSGIRLLLQDSRLAHTAIIMETPLQKKSDGHIDWEQEKLHQDLVVRLLLQS